MTIAPFDSNPSSFNFNGTELRYIVITLKVLSNMSGYLYFLVEGSQVTDNQLKECAQLFSQHYGVWSIGSGRQHKSRVTMGTATLRKQCFDNPSRCVLVKCMLEQNLIGHLFATTWNYDEDIILWITQLVVHTDHRKRGIATSMARMLKDHPDCAKATIVGIASSHPAACNTLQPRRRIDERY